MTIQDPRSGTSEPVERARQPGRPFDEGVALVVGGASGIGRACAEEFAAAGSAVVVADFDADLGQKVVDELAAGGGRASFVACDVRDAPSVQMAVDHCEEAFGGLDYAVNSAGLGGTPTAAPLAGMEIDAFDQLIATNLRGVFLCLRAELAAMSHHRSGAIVNLASAAGLVGVRNSAAYTASKHGVVGLTKTAALDYAETGIRVNAICPGMTATPLVAAGMDRKYRSVILAAHPMRRTADPAEIASAALWLCSPGASFTTGAALPVDGGMTSV